MLDSTGSVEEFLCGEQGFQLDLQERLKRLASQQERRARHRNGLVKLDTSVLVRDGLVELANRCMYTRDAALHVDPEGRNSEVCQCAEHDTQRGSDAPEIHATKGLQKIRPASDPVARLRWQHVRAANNPERGAANVENRCVSVVASGFEVL